MRSAMTIYWVLTFTAAPNSAQCLSLKLKECQYSPMMLREQVSNSNLTLLSGHRARHSHESLQCFDPVILCPVNLCEQYPCEVTVCLGEPVPRHQRDVQGSQVRLVHEMEGDTETRGVQSQVRGLFDAQAAEVAPCEKVLILGFEGWYM